MKSQENRPLSPHLQIYKWELTMAMSILHRVTGVASTLGLVMLAVWLALAAQSEALWQKSTAFFNHPLILLVLVLWSMSLFYHLGTGVRHLLWDVGKGLNKQGAKMSGYVVLVATFVLTVIFWAGIFLAKGA